MKCRQVIEALSDYMDDNEDADQGDSIDLHLESCTACSGFLNTFQRTVAFCRDTTVPPLSDEERGSLRAEARKAYDRSLGKAGKK